MAKKTIGLAITTSPYSGGVFQYENLLAEALWNNRDKYNLVVICNESYWINWCIERNIKFIEDKIEPLDYRTVHLLKKYPFISILHNVLFKQKSGMAIKEEIELLLYGQQGRFLPGKRIKQLCTIHDLMHRYEAGFAERGAACALYEDMLFACEMEYASAVLVDSNLGKTQVIESYLSKKKHRPLIQVLPYTVSRHIKESEEEYIAVPDKYVFYPAQFWQHKNHLNLLRAVNLLKETLPDIHLVLVGSEKNALGRVERYIRENSLEDFVTIYGFVTNRQITYLYRHATLMVMPSYYGPTNIPPLEAMALGCPVAVSGNYAMGEQVGDAGLLFNPDSPGEIAECIRQVWTDGGLRETMRQKGYQRTARWQPEDFERVLIQTIDAVLGKG